MFLTQNKEMKRDGVWNFTLPAWVVELPDGSHFNVCPNAGACAKFCYARNGTYLFPKVRGKHLSNLLLVRDDPAWVEKIAEELNEKRFNPKSVIREIPGLDSVDHLSVEVQEWILSGGQAVRIHDSGDFFTRDYLNGWIELANRFPWILFYAYTKEVEMLEQARSEDVWPSNFLVCYSMGGRQDNLIDVETMRHADVFPSLEAIWKSGYMSQHESDLLSVLLPTTKIGIPQNNIRHFKKRLGDKTFSEAQADRTRKVEQSSRGIDSTAIAFAEVRERQRQQSLRRVNGL